MDKDRLLSRRRATCSKEKAVLAGKVRRRVRNNLQLVYAMLSKQLVGENGAAQDRVGAIARRVMAVSQVYEHLLGTKSKRTIKFTTYLSSLCSKTRSVGAAPASARGTDVSERPGRPRSGSSDGASFRVISGLIANTMPTLFRRQAKG